MIDGEPEQKNVRDSEDARVEPNEDEEDLIDDVDRD